MTRKKTIEKKLKKLKLKDTPKDDPIYQEPAIIRFNPIRPKEDNKTVLCCLESSQLLLLPKGPVSDALQRYEQVFGKRVPLFVYECLPLKQLVEIITSACDSGKEVEDWEVYFQDE